MAALVFLLHFTSSVTWTELLPQQLPNSGGLGSDLHYLLWSDTSLIRLQPKTLCLARQSSKRWCLILIHTAIARTTSITDTGNAANWSPATAAPSTSLGRQVPSWPHEALLGTASQVPVWCLSAFFPPPFPLFFQQGYGKNRFVSLYIF